MPNGQMLEEEQNKSGETSEINVVDGGSVSSDRLDWGEDSTFFREIINMGELLNRGILLLSSYRSSIP